MMDEKGSAGIMTEEHLVSIIIPCYNYARFLPETLKSILDQTYDNWEALVIDDGSEDDTQMVAQSFTSLDARIRYHRQQRKGVSEARNLGLKLSKGQFIQFLDADDLLSRSKLEIQTQELKHNKEIDIVYAKPYYFDTLYPDKLYSSIKLKNKEWVPRLSGEGFELIKALFARNIFVISSPLFRRSILTKVQGFDQNMSLMEDWDFWLRCAINNCRFQYTNHTDAFTSIRVHRHNSSRQIYNLRKSELRIREEIDVYISKIKWVSRRELALLKELNQKQKLKLYKYVVYGTKPFHFKELVNIGRKIGLPRLVVYYVKARFSSKANTSSRLS